MLNNLKIQSKIIVVMSIILFLVLSFVVAKSYVSYQDQYDKAIEKMSNESVKDLDRSMGKNLEIGLSSAISLSTNNLLMVALNNNDKSSAIKELKSISRFYKENTNLKNVKIHMHTNDNYSFMRSWKPEKNGDDLSSFRFGIQKVIKDKKPIAVLELGRAGVAFRGISPIFNDDKYIGSIEFIQGAKSIAQEYEDKGWIYAILLNSEALKISKKAEKNKKIGSYVLANDNWFSEKSINIIEKENIDKIEDPIEKDGYLITKVSLFDMRGKEIGVQIIGEPTDEIVELLNNIKDNAINEILVFLGSMLIMAVSGMLLIRKFVIKPVNNLKNVISSAKDDGNFSNRMELSKSMDEVSLMGRDFNELMSLLEDAINETSDVVEAIKDGDFSKRVNSDLKGGLKKLKDSVNESVENVESTMNEINSALENLGNSNFSYEVNTDGFNGEFKKAINNSSMTLNTLNTAVSEINQVIFNMSNSDFTTSIDSEMNGDLKELKDNINSAVNNLKLGFDNFEKSLSGLIEGDLTTEVKGDYNGSLKSLQEIINSSLKNISEIFSEIKSVSELALERVGHLNGENNNLNDRTQSQAASLEETASAMEEMTSTLSNAMENSALASELAVSSSKKTLGGVELITRVKDSMEKIETSNKRIDNFASLIETIAFQTNLLALNAAVEAARAGEHGRGFAVVASEVRSLAQRTAEASKEITELVNETSTVVSDGNKLTDETATSLDEINSDVKKVVDAMGSIETSSKEQHLGIIQINSSISSIDAITQKNSNLVESLSSSSMELNDQVERIVELMNNFKIN